MNEWDELAEMRNRLETPEEQEAFDAALAKIIDERLLYGTPGETVPVGIMQAAP